MNQDTLIQALATHLDPEAVIEAKKNGTMFSYYVTLAQNILGNNTQTPTRRQPNRQVRQEAIDLNQNQETTNENERPARQTTRTTPARQPAQAARNNATGDRVGVRQL